MITRIVLDNYKSHEHSVLNLGRLTAIVGDNDVGKSAVHKAAELVLFNQDFPVTHIRRGSKEACISIWLADVDKDGELVSHRSISRYRSQKGSTTTLTHVDGTIEHLRGQKNLDEIIQAFTGFGKVALEKEGELENLQFIPSRAQDYAPLYSPEGILKRIVNLMSGASISNVLTGLDKDKRKQASVVETKRAVLTVTETALEKINCTDWASLQERLDRNIELRQVLDNDTSRLGRLEVLRDTYNNVLKTVAMLSNRLPTITHKLTSIQTAELTIEQYCKPMLMDLYKYKNLSTSISLEEELLAATQEKLDRMRNGQVCPKCGELLD